LQPTSDPTVFIEEQRPGYVRYRRTDGRRWVVRGFCDRRGDCLIGAVVEIDGKPVMIEDHEHLAKLREQAGKERIDSEIDVPVTPEFDTCCGADIFEYEELEPVEAF
jgi:hypothetical protein